VGISPEELLARFIVHNSPRRSLHFFFVHDCPALPNSAIETSWLPLFFSRPADVESCLAIMCNGGGKYPQTSMLPQR